jgi:uncharacterized protein YhaN
MAEQMQAKNPAEEMVKFWQSWMSAGLDAMQRTAMLFAPGGSLSEWTAGLHDQVGKAVQAAFEAAHVPTAQDYQRLIQELGGLRAHAEAMRSGLAALDSLVKGQQAMWQALEGSVQQATKAQQEMRHAMAAWTSQWEERMVAVTRGMEEWRQHWDEMLHQGLAAGQASQKALEDLTKTTWELSQKMMGGPR